LTHCIKRIFLDVKWCFAESSRVSPATPVQRKKNRPGPRAAIKNTATMPCGGRFALPSNVPKASHQHDKTVFFAFPEGKHSGASNEKTTDQREECIVSLGNKIFLQ